MKNKFSTRNSLGWGIQAFDNSTGGVPSGNLSIVETADDHSGVAISGQFLHRAVRTGEKSVLVTFDTAEVFLENFLSWDLDFRSAIKKGSLVYLNYNAHFGNEIALSQDYDAMYEEIFRMAGGVPERVAFHQVDTLVSLGNLVLMNNCAQKFAHSAAKYGKNSGVTTLGQFLQFGDSVHRDLGIAFHKTAAGYFQLAQREGRSIGEYMFSVKKLPWHSYRKEAMALKLVEGKGFVGENSSAHSAAA